jgi:hypothetical protein
MFFCKRHCVRFNINVIYTKLILIKAEKHIEKNQIDIGLLVE